MTFDEANPGLGDIDSCSHTSEVLNLDLSRFDSSLTGFAWPLLTSDLGLSRVDLPPIGFPVARRTFDKLRHCLSNLQQASSPICDLRQSSPELCQASPSLDLAPTLSDDTSGTVMGCGVGCVAMCVLICCVHLLLFMSFPSSVRVDLLCAC